MLEIFVDNKKLDLPSDIEIDVTWENPFILQDRIPLPYSMSFELPLTKKNLSAYKNPDRQNSVGNWEKRKAQIIFNTISIGVGKMELTEVNENLNTDFIGSYMPDIVKKKMSKLSAADGFLYSFGDGESRFFPTFEKGWSLLYKNEIYNSAINIGGSFAACPVRVTNEEWEYDKTGYGSYNADKLYFNFWNVANGNYLIVDGAATTHAAIFPQPYIYWLFEKVIGSSLGNNFFKENEELKTLAMVSSFHKNYSDSLMSTYRGVILDNTYYYKDDNYFYMNSFMPKYSFSEFLKDILKIFCCSLIPKPDGTLDIVHNKEIVESNIITNWTNKLVGIPTKSKQAAQIYTYGYSSGSSTRTETYAKQIESIEELLLDTTKSGTYKIANTNEIIEKTLEDKDDEADDDVFTYATQDTGLTGNETVENDEADDDDDTDSYGISTSAKPVPMTIAEYWTTNDNEIFKKWNVPEFPDDRTENSSAPYIGFVRGFYDVSSKTTTKTPETFNNKYPLMTPYNYDPAGNKVGDYSLAWEGDDGLINKFHTEFKAWVEKDRQILEGTFNLSALDLKNIDPMVKIYCNGKLFYYKKIEVTITQNKISLADVTLIEA